MAEGVVGVVERGVADCKRDAEDSPGVVEETKGLLWRETRGKKVWRG